MEKRTGGGFVIGKLVPGPRQLLVVFGFLTKTTELVPEKDASYAFYVFLSAITYIVIHLLRFFFFFFVLYATIF